MWSSTGWNSFVLRQILQWEDDMYSWIPNIRRGGVLHYENLIQNLPGELRKIVQYLSLPLDKRRYECTIKHNFKTFHRNAIGHERISKMYKEIKEINVKWPLSELLN